MASAYILILFFIILSSCSTPYSKSDTYYETLVGHIVQTILSGDCNSKCISSIVSSDLKNATYAQAINVINKVSIILPSIFDGVKRELTIKVEEKYKKSFYLTPIRESKKTIYCGAVVFGNKISEEIAKKTLDCLKKMFRVKFQELHFYLVVNQKLKQAKI